MRHTLEPKRFVLHLAVLNSLLVGLLSVPIVASAAPKLFVFEGPVPRPEARQGYGVCEEARD